MELAPLFNIVKYTHFLLCLYELRLTETTYFSNFLNCLIIEFFKVGMDKEFLRQIDKDTLHTELEKITNSFFESYTD